LRPARARVSIVAPQEKERLAVTIVLHGMGSHNVYKAAIMLEECGLPYRIVRVDVFSGGQFDPAFRKISPNSKVPAIVDPDGPDGEPIAIFESGAILLYLGEKTGVLWPTDPRFRSSVMQWLFMQVGSVGPMFGQFNHFGKYAPAGLDRYAYDRYRTEVLRVLAGADYSLADVATWPRLKLLHKDLVELDRHDHAATRRWIDVISERPAVIRAIAAMESIVAEDGSTMAQASSDGLDRLFGRGRFAAARPT
jgi:GST-like protein